MEAAKEAGEKWEKNKFFVELKWITQTHN